MRYAVFHRCLAPLLHVSHRRLRLPQGVCSKKTPALMDLTCTGNVASTQSLHGLDRASTMPFKSLLTHKTYLLPMQVTDASKAEVARRERERLRLQAKQKKEQLEKLRDQQNDDTATGEVSSHQSPNEDVACLSGD